MLQEKWFKSSACAPMLLLIQCTNQRWVHWTSINISTSALDLNHFLSNKIYSCIDLIYTWQKKQNQLFMSVKNYRLNGFKMPLNMIKLLIFFWSVDVIIMCAIEYQKHLAQSGRSKRSVVDIFNTLRVAYLLKSIS